MSSEYKRAKTSVAWEYFTVHDEKTSTAKCKICGDLLSFRSSVSNLMKHVKRCHKDVCLGYERFESSENESNVAKNDSDSEAENAIKNLETGKDDDDDHVEIYIEEKPVCLFCKTKFPDNESSTLMDHMVRVHKINETKIVDGTVQFEQDLSKQRKRKWISVVWNYCSIEDPIKKIARCNLCDIELSFKGTVTNLNRHLNRVHRIYQFGLNEETDDENMVKKRSSNNLPVELKSFFNYTDHFKDEIACVLCRKIFKVLDGMDHLKTHMMEEHPEELLHSDMKYPSTNGDPLYLKNGDYNKEKDQTDMEEYLESEDDFDTRQGTPRRQNLEWSKRKRSRPVDVKPKIWDHNVKNRRLRPYFPERTKQTQNLEYFSKYVASLLQDLPDIVSKKLQMDFIKNILEAQISCHKKDFHDISTTTTDLNPNSNMIVNGGDGIVIEVLNTVTNERDVSEDSVLLKENSLRQ